MKTNVTIAKQGGFQPATGVDQLADVLNPGDCFTANQNHIDFPGQTLVIPEFCVGIVDRSMNDHKSGTVSILRSDTITARRLIKKIKDKNEICHL